MLKMTKFEMKKNELLEKGKQEGYLLVSEVIEIAKECKASKAEVMAFQKEIKEEKIELLEKEPAKKEIDSKILAIYKDLEEQMKKIMGTKVSINSKNEQQGKLEIEYYSQEELDRIIDLLRTIQ